MKRAFLLAFCTAATSFAAPVVINVYAAVGPNQTAAFNTWATNSVEALKAGVDAWGTPGTPTYFHTTTSVMGNEIMVTSFPSWMGAVDPGTAFGPAFANEHGNRLYFPLHILGDAVTQFSISNLSMEGHSTAVPDGLAFSFATGLYNYSTNYVGLDWGPDKTKGTADDVWVTSGPNTRLVNELFGRGSGNAYWPCGPGDPTPCATNAERQLALDATASYPAYGSPYQITATWTLAGPNGGSQSISVDVTPTPEPASLVLVGAAGLLCVIGRKKLKR